jgi:LPPG:FO 2-phospho-L-lactate transferase
VDTVLYTLAGIVDRERGWGIAGDTFHCLDALTSLGSDTWFRLGDRDLATHLMRTERLRRGVALSATIDELRRSLGVRSRILPMSDDTARTRLRTASGVLRFQEYFVKLRHEPEVLEADFSEAARSRPAPGVLDAIAECDGVIVAPSNPVLSIGPILAVPEIRETLRTTAARIAAVSPIVGGRALKGPAARNLASLGLEASAASVAELYKDFLDVFVLDRVDRHLQEEIEQGGIRAVAAETVMSSQEAKLQLAATVLGALSDHPEAAAPDGRS